MSRVQTGVVSRVAVDLRGEGGEGSAEGEGGGGEEGGGDGGEGEGEGIGILDPSHSSREEERLLIPTGRQKRRNQMRRPQLLLLEVQVTSIHVHVCITKYGST